MPEKQLVRAAAYARFSSEMQREESINAQLRAIDEFAKREGYILTSRYIDRAKSATTDQRPEFQRMIADSAKGLFDVVLVHKLDRFARNRYDSAHYKYQLKKNGVLLRSVSENLDGSPESIVLESVLEGMAEYYSRNLAREVEKGKRENALKGQHVGGIPPLGYNVDTETKSLILNACEAQAVRLIFDSYLKGYGYGQIISALNAKGYRTKKGKPFGKGSIHEILRNEKYMGVYTYNKAIGKDPEGKYNRHRYKDDEEIIRVKDAVPAIVTPEEFRMVQSKMNERQHKAARFTAKQSYLLSGKIVCGECGSSFVGNSRKPRPDHPLYVSYRCGRKNGAIRCGNPEINRDKLEKMVLKQLADRIFDEAALPKLIRAYREFIQHRDTEAVQQKNEVQNRLREIDSGIQNIVKVVMQTGSVSLSQQLGTLEEEKASLENNLIELNLQLEG